MNCCRNTCAYLAVIIGLVAGIILGVLYAFGFVATGVIFWAYLLFGVLGILLAPLYASASNSGCGACFCRLRNLFYTASIGAVILAAVGLIVSALTSAIATAIVLGLATVFVVMELVSVVCVTDCSCDIG